MCVCVWVWVWVRVRVFVCAPSGSLGAADPRLEIGDGRARGTPPPVCPAQLLRGATGDGHYKSRPTIRSQIAGHDDGTTAAVSLPGWPCACPGHSRSGDTRSSVKRIGFCALLGVRLPFSCGNGPVAL